jgi:hypothetical protein
MGGTLWDRFMLTLKHSTRVKFFAKVEYKPEDIFITLYFLGNL